MTSSIAGNQSYTEVFNLAGQLPELNVADLTVGNAVLMSGLTVSTIAGDPNLALTGAVTLGAAADRLAFFGQGVQARQTTAIAAGAFVANASGIANDTATFNGYTLGQISAALVLYGLLT